MRLLLARSSLQCVGHPWFGVRALSCFTNIYPLRRELHRVADDPIAEDTAARMQFGWIDNWVEEEALYSVHHKVAQCPGTVAGIPDAPGFAAEVAAAA